MSTGISQDSRYWRQLHRAALSEIGKNKLPERIAEAEKAVVLRARELFQAAGDLKHQAFHELTNAQLHEYDDIHGRIRQLCRDLVNC